MNTPATRMTAASTKAILLHPEDNVLVSIQPINVGDVISIDGVDIAQTKKMVVGHKIARFNFLAGDKVIKYGAPIGSMVSAATKGEHVHVHNMKSDYIPSHSRQLDTNNSTPAQGA